MPVLLAAICGSYCAAPARAAQRALENLEQARAKLQKDYAAQLEELAVWCEEHGLPQEAQKTRQAARPRDPWTLYLVTLPSTHAAEKKPPLASGAAGQWQDRFEELERKQADALLALARQAMRAKHPSLAYELVLEMVRANPQSDEGRKLLGFSKYKGQWHTPFEIDKLRRGNVWDDRFGWLPQAYLPRYEAGERYYNNRWITAEQEAQIRGDMSSAWHVETEHYSIRTNHSLEAGVKVGQRLERLYRAWQQTFASYYATPDQLLKLFEGRGGDRRSASPKHLVYYFRNRDEYLQALQGEIPPDVETTGIYLGQRRTAFFFATEDGDYTTLYHEASHQLFSETREVVDTIGLRGNFWIVEGIACYMESFEEHEGYDTLGGTSCPRLEAAKFRRLEDNFYIPLEQLVLYGMNDLKRDPRIRMIYSQCAGLAHFLMHYDDGRYRDALVAYLQSIYSGEDDAGTLSQLTGKSYEELNAEYRDFLARLPDTKRAAAP